MWWISGGLEVAYVTPEYAAPKSIDMDKVLTLDNALFLGVSGVDFVMRLEKEGEMKYVSSTTLCVWGKS
jgi:hypothetical protein